MPTTTRTASAGASSTTTRTNRRAALLRRRSPDHRRSRRPRARAPLQRRDGESGDVHIVADLFGSLPAGDHAGPLFLSAEGAVQGGMLDLRAIPLTSNQAMTLRPIQSSAARAPSSPTRRCSTLRNRDPHTAVLVTRVPGPPAMTAASAPPCSRSTCARAPASTSPASRSGAAARTDGHPARCDTARAALSSRCTSTSTRATAPEATTFSRTTEDPPGAAY